MRLVMEEKRRERKEKKEPVDRNLNRKTDRLKLPRPCRPVEISSATVCPPGEESEIQRNKELRHFP